MSGDRAADMNKGILDALDRYIQENGGRAPRLIEMPAADWTFMRDFLKDHRDAGFIVPAGLDPAKLGGRENFVMYGVPVVASTREGIEAPEGSAE